MNAGVFDRFTRSRAAVSRRPVLASLAALGPALALAPATVGKKRGKKKKKVTLCLDRQTIKVSKKQREAYFEQGATPGKCPPCTVTCTGSPMECGAQLQQAMQAGGTIHVCPGLYEGVFTMGSATLVGFGSGDDPATSTILDAAGAGRVLTLLQNSTVKLIGLRIRSGSVVGLGGGIAAAASDLRIIRCVVTGNAATDKGGGIYALGALRLTSSTVAGNTAGAGGGILTGGPSPTFITDSVIADNMATGGVAGGIFTGLHTLTITGTEIRSNSSNASAGGIFNSEGTVILDASSRIVDNTAPTSGAILNAGGIVVLGGAAVSGNSAPQCTAVPGC